MCQIGPVNRSRKKPAPGRLRVQPWGCGRMSRYSIRAGRPPGPFDVQPDQSNGGPPWDPDCLSPPRSYWLDLTNPSIARFQDDFPPQGPPRGVRNIGCSDCAQYEVLPSDAWWRSMVMLCIGCSCQADHSVTTLARAPYPSLRGVHITWPSCIVGGKAFERTRRRSRQHRPCRADCAP